MSMDHRKFRYSTMMAAIIGGFLSISSIAVSAELPQVRVNQHPRVLVDQADLDRLKTEIAGAASDSALFNARENLFNWVEGFKANFRADTLACTQDADYCHIRDGERGHILTTAKNLVLAYHLAPYVERLTGNVRTKAYYQELAQRYINGIVNVAETDPGVNGEKSMGARIAALGFFYDWMYTELEKDRPRILNAIVKTIGTDRTIKNSTGQVVNTTDDLIGYICNGKFDASKFTCSIEPNYTSSAAPSIAFGYLGGHHATASMNTLTALLAIYDEFPQSRSLMEIIYKHFEQGVYAARADVSQTGGHHMGYGYAATSTDFGDRIITWRRGFFDPVPIVTESGKTLTKLFESDPNWHGEIIFPFIYGLRMDTRFPASGDNFEFTVKQIPRYTLHAAMNSDKGGYATWFYQSQIASNRDPSTYRDLLWDKLLYSNPPKAENYSGLPLARWFTRSGQVLMRDTWNYSLATLLEFKSSEFMSRNHHHLDQNSFSIYYKEPLLVDSGAYDDYGSDHWANYYTRTVAHNTITVTHPTEEFKDGSKSYVNDGGQWFHGKKFDPLPVDILSTGMNALKGVTNFDTTDKYTYARGDASRAYWDQKVDQEDGFIREIVYLRSGKPTVTASDPKPVTLVYDRVRTRALSTATGDQPLVAKSLLHFVGVPETGSPPGKGQAGVYPLSFPDRSSRKLTSRNGTAMIRAEILLPQINEVKLIGGPLPNDVSCAKSENAPAAAAADCRFLVEKSPGEWVNYPPAKNLSKDSGKWRVEIPGQLDQAGKTQHFLTVFSVGDNDPDKEPLLAESQLLSAQQVAGNASVPGHIVAITTRKPGTRENEYVEEYRVVGFNRGKDASTAYRWSGGPNSGEAILTGMEPNQKYIATRTSSNQYTVTKSDTGDLSSSKDGIVQFSLEDAKAI